MFNGPSRIWKMAKAGHYPTLTVHDAALRIAGEYLRVTAYGDPAFVPFDVWDGLLTHARGWAGYTHQWRDCDPRFRALLMASVETPDERLIAEAHGWRTFRARAPQDEMMAGEFACPASDEMGHRATCAQCQLCRGTSSPAKSVAILLHGKGAAAYRGPRAKYGQIRADLAERGHSELHLKPEERARVMLALKQFYLRRKQAVILRSARIADGVYRFTVGGRA
jgi:hypothetical protein